MIKYITILAVFILGITNLKAQEAKHLYSKTEQYAPEKWVAKWIVTPEISKEDKNSIMLARKEFSIENMSQNNVLYITADSHYKLWVNGKFVTRGPARSNAHHQSYDVLEVSEFLQKGKNVLAVQVHYHGIMKSYYNDPYPGLLVQLEMGNENNKRYIVSDKSWKLTKDKAWNSKTKWVNSVNANNFSSSYDFRQAKHNWYKVIYNSENWNDAIFQKGPRTFPKKPVDYVPYAVQNPWFTLVSRDLPNLLEYDAPVTQVFKVTEAAQYSNYEQHWGGNKGHDALQSAIHDIQKPLKHSKVLGLKTFIKGEGELEIRNAYPKTTFAKSPVWNTTIIFDYKHVQDGYPYIKAKGAPGAIVDINYAPYLIDDTFHPSVLAENFSDRIILSGKEDYWENPEIRTFRYVAVTIRSQQPVTFDDIGVRIEEYPFEEKGKIEVNEEPFINQLWKATEKTLQSITTDAFTDNYQERRQYVQTSFYAALGNYATYGDNWLQRRYLVQHAQDQLPNGIMPMWAPWGIYEGNKQVPGIFEANHFWLMGLHDYFLYTGDKKTTEELLVSAERCANAINQVDHKNGLIYKPPYSYWIDWAKLAQGDQNFIINALQLIAFDQYAELLFWLNKPEKAEKWKLEAINLRESLKAFWSAENQLFAENITNGKIDDSFSEHANALAIVAGVASKAQKETIISKIINNNSDRSMEESVLFNYWVSKAICENGNVIEAVEFLKSRYQHMLEEGENGTLWEYANLHAQSQSKPHFESENLWKGRSWCTAQAENCFPGIILSEYILGIRVISPGCKEVEIASYASPFKKMKGSLPTPKGLIQVNKNKNELIVVIPTGVLAILRKESLLNEKVNKITLDGKTINISTIQQDILLTTGTHRINIIEI